MPDGVKNILKRIALPNTLKDMAVATTPAPRLIEQPSTEVENDALPGAVDRPADAIAAPLLDKNTPNANETR